MRKIKESISSILLASSGIVIIFVIWQLITMFSPSSIIPSPLEVFRLFVQMMVGKVGKYSLQNHVLVSVVRVSVGFAASAVVGISLGLIMAISNTARAIIKPIFEAIRPIPGLAWIPIAILWFGLGEFTKYFIIFMGGLGHVAINTYAGVKQVDSTLMGAARMLGVRENRLFFKVIMPSIITNIFAGLQVSLSTSWMSVIAAEMVSSQEGVGWVIIMGMNSGNMAQIFVGMVSIGIVGLLLATIMRNIERRLDVWKIQGI